MGRRCRTRPRPGPIPRTLVLGAIALGGCLIGAASVRALAEPVTPIRIAISSFVGEEPVGGVAAALSERLEARPVERLIAPSEFIAHPDMEPLAAEIRRWAHITAVDAIVVGRVGPAEDGDRSDTIVEAAIRSGHSGAELWRHQIRLGRGGNFRASIDRLASLILAKLGDHGAGSGQAASTDDGDRSVAGRASRSGGEITAGGRDDEARGPGFRTDAPIEIKADEAEIIDLEGGRKLVFHRNVRVRQADVTLRSDRLEASYHKGEAEPRRLVADGRVRVDQGGRRAECDHAVYLRASQRLSCKGKATLVQGCDVVRGDAIEFDFEGNRVRVEGAASILIEPEAEGSSQCVPDRNWM